MKRTMLAGLLMLSAPVWAKNDVQIQVPGTAGRPTNSTIVETVTGTYFTESGRTGVGQDVIIHGTVAAAAEAGGTGATLYSVEADVIMPVAPRPSATWTTVEQLASASQGKGATIYSVEPDVRMTITVDPSATFVLGAGTAHIGQVSQTAGSTWYEMPKASNLSVTVTGAADTAVTLSVPSASGLFHYITQIEIIKYVTAAITANAAPIIVTTTNLPGAMDFNFRRVGAVADAETAVYNFAAPLQSSAVTTATTIVFPAVTGVKWVARVTYYTAP